MDSDDICIHDRFETQLNFLLNNNLDACGSYIQYFGSLNYLKTFPTNYDNLKFLMQFGSQIAHPTAFFKKSFFEKLKYKEEYKFAEDYEMWKCAIIAGKKIGNVPSVLLKYRTHNNQSSIIAKSIQAEKSYFISHELSEFVYGNKYIDLFSKYKFGYLNCLNQIDSYNFLENFLLETKNQNIEIRIINNYFISILSRIDKFSLVYFLKYFKLSKKYNLGTNSIFFIFLFINNLLPRKTSSYFIKIVKKFY
jgi:hypothetical protein